MRTTGVKSPFRNISMRNNLPGRNGIDVIDIRDRYFICRTPNIPVKGRKVTGKRRSEFKGQASACPFFSRPLFDIKIDKQGFAIFS
jgi:hypothetical protein